MVYLNGGYQSVGNNNRNYPAQQYAVQHKKHASDKIDNSDGFYLFGNKRQNQKRHSKIADNLRTHFVIFNIKRAKLRKIFIFNNIGYALKPAGGYCGDDG